MVAQPQLLFNDNSSASTLPTIDSRISPQFSSQPILFQEPASPVVLRLAASNLFESPRPEPDPVVGRLEADVVKLPVGTHFCLVFECGPGPGGYRALGSGVMVKAATWFLRTGTEGKTQVVYVLRDRRLSQGTQNGMALKRLLAWYGACLEAEDSYLGWVRPLAFRNLLPMQVQSGRQDGYRFLELCSGVRKDLSDLEHQRFGALARFLYDRGAHFVLTNGEKLPVGESEGVKGKGWLERRPALSEVLRHREEGGLLGLVPWSVGLSVLDVDEGSPGELMSVFPPALMLKSRTLRRYHVYYRDVRGRGNGNWAGYKAAGQVRSGSGFVVLWQGLGALAGMLAAGAGGVLFPESSVVLTVDRSKRFGPAWEPAITGGLAPWEMSRSTANGVLFEQLRLWAYRERDKPPFLDLWLERVAAKARELAVDAGFLGLLSPQDVMGIASSVGSWVWAEHRGQSGEGRRRTNSVQQRKRALVRWYGCEEASVVENFDIRDYEIGRQAVKDGLTTVQLVKKYGLGEDRFIGWSSDFGPVWNPGGRSWWLPGGRGRIRWSRQVSSRSLTNCPSTRCSMSYED